MVGRGRPETTEKHREATKVARAVGERGLTDSSALTCGNAKRRPRAHK